MRESVGDPNFPIWLIADSQPEQWQGDLITPLDPNYFDFVGKKLAELFLKKFISEWIWIS